MTTFTEHAITAGTVTVGGHDHEVAPGSMVTHSMTRDAAWVLDANGRTVRLVTPDGVSDLPEILQTGARVDLFKLEA